MTAKKQDIPIDVFASFASTGEEFVELNIHVRGLEVAVALPPARARAIAAMLIKSANHIDMGNES